MDRARIVIDGNNETWVWFWCAGCNTHHAIVSGRWTWNGSLERPTFTPSVLVSGTVPLTDDEVAAVMAGATFEPKPLRCHSFVTDGRIQYLSDSGHALAGQTVDLDPIDESMGAP